MRGVSRSSLVALACVIGSGCGGTAPPPATPATESAACASASADATEAWSTLASQAEQAARPPEDAPPDAERALDRLEAHVEALRGAPREISGDEALELSNAVMDAVDALHGQIPASLRDRADRAAEAILTDRSEQGSLRAAADAKEVLEQVLQTVRPGSIEARAERRSMATLSRRARATAEAYRDRGPQRGDLRADRSEAIALPGSAPDALRQAHEHAIEVSSTVRRTCRIDRRLAVPAP